MTVAKVLLCGMIAGLAGCRPDQPTAPNGVNFTDLSGKWIYSADDIRGAGLQCTIGELELTLRQIPGAGYFVGESEGGKLECTGGTEPVVIPIQPLPVDSGYTFNEFVSFNLYNRDWRHSGMTTAERMTGTFVLRNGTAVLEGSFQATRSQR